MTSPLDEFANSPRRFRNDDGTEVVSSSLVILGSGLVASRPTGQPGEPTFVVLTVPQLASILTRIAALEAVVEVTATQTRIKNPSGQIVFTAAVDNGNPAMSFFGGTPQPQTAVDSQTVTAEGVSLELSSKNFYQEA